MEPAISFYFIQWKIKAIGTASLFYHYIHCLSNNISIFYLFGPISIFFPRFLFLKLLQSGKIYVINTSISAMNRKIASFRSAERGGHRLKAALGRVAWFAWERLWRYRRSTLRYRGAECPRKPRGNAGGTAEGLPFVPVVWERRAFLFVSVPHAATIRW